MLDQEGESLYFDRATAVEGTFTNYVKATSTSGIVAFKEFIFKVTRKINLTPFFVGEIEDIALLIDQREQVEIGLGLLTYESPTVKDEDGHKV
jgi:hypothetical protein